VAITSIAPVPSNSLDIAVVRKVLREFLVDQERVPIVDIQPCHLEQAYVCFCTNYDRDNFVLERPHLYQDVNILFQRHDRGRSWRRVIFNQEC
jgi:hypothetical protein